MKEDNKTTIEEIRDRTGGLSAPGEIAEYIIESGKYDDMPEIKWIASNYISALMLISLYEGLHLAGDIIHTKETPEQ